MSIQKKYQQWVELSIELADLGYSLRLIDWDAKVMMPPKGIALRTRSHRYLAGLYHEKSTAPEYSRLLEELIDHPDLDNIQRRSILATYRLHQRKIKLPSEFVREAASLYSEAYQAWLVARKEEQLSTFLPFLQKIVDLKRKEVELSGFSGEAYEYFTSYFEPGLKLEEIDDLFNDFKQYFPPLLKELRERSAGEIPEFQKTYPPEKQMQYCKQLISSLGFDRQKGRLDLSEHPFTCGMT